MEQRFGGLAGHTSKRRSKNGCRMLRLLKRAGFRVNFVDSPPYYRARYYDASTSRFVNEDPRFAGPNFYAYVGDNPVNGIDPYGLRCIHKVVLVTAYCDVGPGKDWGYYKPKKKGDRPRNVGPGTLATADTDPIPYPFGSSVEISGDPDPIFHSARTDPFSSPTYVGCIHDTGKGWNPDHRNVPPDAWLDVWMPSCKAALNFGKKWRLATICTPDDCGCKGNVLQSFNFGGRAF